MGNETNRVVVLHADKRHTNYDESKIIVGELVIDSVDGYAWLKVSDGTLVPLRGAGYIDLLEYIKNTTAIGGTPTDLNSFLIDTAMKAPTNGVPTGVFKIRVPKEPDSSEFVEVGLITNGNSCIIYTGENDEEGNPITTNVEDLYIDYIKYKEDTDATLDDHEKRVKDLEDNISERIIDRNIYYRKFNETESQDLVFCVAFNTDDKKIFKNNFESIMVLDLDGGEGVNRHIIGANIDNLDEDNKDDYCYVRDIGNVVNLAVTFYWKDRKLWIRPTQIDGEFILKDKSPNVGDQFVGFNGTVTMESFSGSGLTPDHILAPIGSARNEEATTFHVKQPSHGLPPFSACYYDATDGLWKLATLDNRAQALVIANDEDYLSINTAGHIKLPTGATINGTDAFVPNTMYYLHQEVAGGFQSEEPTYIYQELGYAYSKKGVAWFAINIETPVELAPYAIKGLATKQEVRLRQRVVQNIDELPNIDEPEGTVVTVADKDNWHTRKIGIDKLNDNSIQIQNGLWANEASSDKAIKEELNTKFDKGTPTGNELTEYPDAVTIINALKKKLDVPDSFTGGFEGLMQLIDACVKKAELTQTMDATGTDTAPSSTVFKQLVDLVQSMAEGGTGAIVPQENTPFHVEYGTLQKNGVTISSSVHVLYSPILFLEGQIWEEDKWDCNNSTGIITLKEAYSTTVDVAYVLVDVFPTSIRFEADTVGAVAAAPYASSLKVGDVIRIWGEATKFDGGGHLRIVASSKGLNGVAIGDKWLNEVPNSNGKTLNTAIEARVKTADFNTYKSKNYYTHGTGNVAGYDNTVIRTDTLRWTAGESAKNFEMSIPGAIANAISALAVPVSADTASAMCYFAVSNLKVSGNIVTGTVTPYINGQQYTATKNTMQSNLMIIAGLN